ASERGLQECSVGEVPTRVSEHGTEGRVCDGAPSSGGASYRASFIANRSGAPCESQAGGQSVGEPVSVRVEPGSQAVRSEEHTSELQSRFDLVCRLLLENKN